jgi:hypothetical protein
MILQFFECCWFGFAMQFSPAVVAIAYMMGFLLRPVCVCVCVCVMIHHHPVLAKQRFELSQVCEIPSTRIDIPSTKTTAKQKI